MGDRVMKALLTIVLLGGISVAVFALGTLHRKSDDKSILHVAEEMPLTVKVARPERRGIVKLVQAPGDVEAVLEVEISSEIVAKIEEMPVEEGDVVARGQLLCRLNDDDLKAAVESGQAQVGRLRAMIQQAEADLEQAERDCKRQADLSEVNATSDKELFDHLVARKKARAVLEMRTQELAEAAAFFKRVQEDLKRTIIESPIRGVVSKLNAKQGEVVVTGTMNNPGTVIMSVSDLSKMQVRARVDEVDVPLVKRGQSARLYLQSDQQVPVPARVVRVASKGTRLEGRDVVYFETLLEVLSDDPRIKPGMTANVEIEVDRREDAITIPVEAIVHRMRKDLDEKTLALFDAKQTNLDLSARARQAQYIKVVYVMDGEAAQVRLVEPGIADTHRVELADGIRLDDLVITGPYRSLDQLKDGRKVALGKDDKKELEKSSAEEASPAEEDATEERLAGEDREDKGSNEGEEAVDAGAAS